MATEFNTPFDLYRANLGIALRSVVSAHEWRQHAWALEKLRIERDLEALRQASESVAAAKDWSELTAAFQNVLRDYLAAGTNIWQHGAGIAVQTQKELGESVRDGLKGGQPGWQSAWFDQWQKIAGTSPLGAPLRDWMSSFGRAVSGVADGYTAFNPVTQPVQNGSSAAGARARATRGDQHAA